MQALIFDALKKEMPKLGGKDKKQRELIAGLEEVRNSTRFGATLRNSTQFDAIRRNSLTFYPSSQVFFKVMKGHNIPQGDFPDVNKFRHTLATSEACRDFSKFKKLDDRLLQQLDAIIANDIGALLQRFEAIGEGGMSEGASPPPRTAPAPAPAPVPASSSTASDPWAE